MRGRVAGRVVSRARARARGGSATLLRLLVLDRLFVGGEHRVGLFGRAFAVAPVLDDGFHDIGVEAGHLGFLEDLTNPHYQKHFDRLFEFVPGSNIDPVYFDSPYLASVLLTSKIKGLP